MVSGGRLAVVAVMLMSCRSGFKDRPAADAQPPLPDAPELPASCGGKTVTPVEAGSILGSTSNESNEFFGTCVGQNGAEAVFSVAIDDAVQDLVVDVNNASFDGAVYVRTDCGTSPLAELDCSSGGTAFARDLSPGTVYVFVDSKDGSAGTFELDVLRMDRTSSACDPSSTSRRCAVENECVANVCEAATCSGAIAQTDGFTATGSTTGQSIHAGTCAGGGLLAPEVIFEISLTADVSELTASTVAPGTDYDTLLYLRPSCSGDEIACNDDVDGNNNRSLLTTGPLVAGTYLLFVDGFNDRRGDFDLTVTITP